MSNPITPEAAQARIDRIQSLYREWERLLPELEAAQEQWQHAMQLMREMSDFYDREYMPLHQAIESGLPYGTPSSSNTTWPGPGCAPPPASSIRKTASTSIQQQPMNKQRLPESFR